jgi:xylulokinase
MSDNFGGGALRVDHERRGEVGFLIGLDVGSQSVKACVLEDTGRRLATATAPCPLDFPESGWAEQDPADWQQAIIHSTSEACRQAGVTRTEEVTIGLASQVDGLVAADVNHRPLRPAIIWMDRRASVQSTALAEAAGVERLRTITGLNPDSSHSGPKTMWLRDHEPDHYRDARWLASVGGYLNGWLTGTTAHDHANASSSLLYDLQTRGWSSELVALAELDVRQLPAIAAAHESIGTLRPELADQMGLGSRTRVVCGTGDDHGATLGAGSIEPGTLVDVTGTAEPVAAPVDAVVVDREGLVETHAHAVDGMLLLENPGFVSGGSTRWLAELTGRTQADLLNAACEARLGSGGVIFVPALSGSMAPRWNEEIRGCFTGLSLGHGVAQLARAVLEGCAYALRDIVDRLDAVGAGAAEMRVVGGGARSDLWLQIKADVTARPVRRVLGDCATSVGAAMLAGIGAQAFTDHEQAVAACVELDTEPVLPDPQAVESYRERYDAYRALFEAVENWTADTASGPRGDRA